MADKPTFHIGDLVRRKDRTKFEFVIEALDSKGDFVFDPGYNSHAVQNIELVKRQLPIATSELIPTVGYPSEDGVSESPDVVNHPSHYKANGFEAIEVIEAFGLDRDFRLGNAAKYLLRAGKKDDELQDLKKAQKYLTRYISSLEGEPKW